MPRSDLLALTLDDLAAFTNRGTVRRAQRELEAGEISCTLAESDSGELTVQWSDGTHCVFPAAMTVSDGRCSCIATTLCRHLVRSVLAYQKQAAAVITAPSPVAEPWDPGTISDDQLQQHFKPAVLASSQARFRQGILVELVRSAKPAARFHQLACTLRFMVPHDLRYTRCDCAEPAPCAHVPLAIWAFRQLPSDQPAGIITSQHEQLPVPVDELDAGAGLIASLVESGMSALPTAWKDRALRLANACTSADLIWPAEVLADLVQQFDRYAAHDARFSPQRVAELVSEWLIRSDAIRSGTPGTPQSLVRGSRTDRATAIGAARYVGLGCEAHEDRAGVTITAYLQDSDSGSVVAVARDFAAPAADAPNPPPDFWQLAERPVLRTVSLAALGAGQLLLQGGKRAADHRLTVGRARATVNPQSYAWESLRAPVLVEDFAELAVRLAALPPMSLRPRYVAENLHVVRVAKVAHWCFDEASQMVEISVLDERGTGARVQFPYLARARAGIESLLAALEDSTRRLCFVAGRVRQTTSGLIIEPICLVVDAQGTRQGIQPWVDRPARAASGPAIRTPASPAPPPVAADYPSQLLREASDLLLVGLHRCGTREAGAWKELLRRGEAMGYDRLLQPVASLSAELEGKLHNPRWTTAHAVQSVMKLVLLAKLAQEVA